MLVQGILLLCLLLIFFLLIRTLVIAITMISPVPFLPSASIYKEAIKHLNIQPGDNVIDVGSGDGRVLLYASKKYPKSSFTGIEKNVFLVIFSNIVKGFLGRKNLKFLKADALDFKYSNFNKIYMYLTPEFVDKVMMKIKRDVTDKTLVINLHFQLGYKFFENNNVDKNKVKYKNKIDYIYIWQK